MMFSKKTPAVLATLFFGISLSGSALACSVDGWDSNSGDVVVGQPFDATPPDMDGIARVEEFCALMLFGTGYVQTNTPSHSEVTNRFYVWADVTGGSGSAAILVGYSDEVGGTELFSIAFDGTNFDFTTTGGGSDSSAAASGWNLIEYHWNDATFEYWLNADALAGDPPTGSFNSGGAATLDSVRIGLPKGLGGLTGMFYFDSFEMHNTTAIGPLKIGDADGNGLVQVFDFAPVQAEAALFELAPGLPDCNLSGTVDVFDFGCIQLIIAGGG